MKQIVLILAISTFCSYQSLGQNVTNEFWGIPFGSSMEKVQQLMDAKPGCTLTQYRKNAAWLYEGCRFGGYDAEFIILNFSSNQFDGVSMVLLPNRRSDDLNQNKEFVNDAFISIYKSLKSKYGPELYSFDMPGKHIIWNYPTGCKTCDLRIDLQELTHQISIEYTNLKIARKYSKDPKSDF